jgi:hypothetical protein
MPEHKGVMMRKSQGKSLGDGKRIGTNGIAAIEAEIQIRTLPKSSLN